MKNTIFTKTEIWITSCQTRIYMSYDSMVRYIYLAFPPGLDVTQGRFNLESAILIRMQMGQGKKLFLDSPHPYRNHHRAGLGITPTQPL